MADSVRHFSILAVVFILLGLGVLACGGSEETTIVRDDDQGPIPSAEEARQALDTALLAFNDHCLRPSAQQSSESYPISVINPNLEDPSANYEELQALVEAGILSRSVDEGEQGLSIHRFSLTSEGRAAQYEVARGRSYESMFCYAVPRVSRLDSIKAVYNSGPNPTANVWFAYRYGDLGQWVESEAVRRSFSGLQLPLPDRDRLRTSQELLIRVDTTWLDRRLTGYPRHPIQSTGAETPAERGR